MHGHYKIPESLQMFRDYIKIRVNWVGLDGNTTITIGEAAKLMQVAPRTVTQYVDKGYIEGYRLPRIDKINGKYNRDKNDPLAGDRRVYRESLFAFMKELGMRVDNVFNNTNAEIALYGLCDTAKLTVPPFSECKQIYNQFELGMYLGSTYQPCRAMILGTGDGIRDTYKIVEAIRKNFAQMIVIILFDESQQLEYNNCTIADIKFIPPYDCAKVIEFAMNYIRPESLTNKIEVFANRRRSAKNKESKDERTAKWLDPNATTRTSET